MSAEMLKAVAEAEALESEMAGSQPGAEAGEEDRAPDAEKPTAAEELRAVLKIARGFPLLSQYLPGVSAVLTDSAVDTWADETGPLFDKYGWSVTGGMSAYEVEIRAAIATFGLGFGIVKAARLDIDKLRGDTAKDVTPGAPEEVKPDEPPAQNPFSHGAAAV